MLWRPPNPSNGTEPLPLEHSQVFEMFSNCKICLEAANPSIATACGHIYCRECIDTWMASRRSNKRCPICQRQLKTEEFRELTSDLCNICHNKAQSPVLTKSGSLCCWPCYFKRQSVLGLPTHDVITIYGTEEETEEETDRDPAIPPRPVSAGEQKTSKVLEEEEDSEDEEDFGEEEEEDSGDEDSGDEDTDSEDSDMDVDDNSEEMMDVDQNLEDQCCLM